jgi:hypothetical protein
MTTLIKDMSHQDLLSTALLHGTQAGPDGLFSREALNLI